MVHPSYIYGKDGYVFRNDVPMTGPFTDYHTTFIDMVIRMRDYCEARSVPFVFVLNPAKETIMEEYVSEGIHYDASASDGVLARLREAGVRCVDNRETLAALYQDGVSVFNQKYDAGHWNDIGAYYGTDASLEALAEKLPGVHRTAWEELTISQKLEETLTESEFPIKEYVPDVSIPGLEIEERNTGFWAELPFSRTWECGRLVNPVRLEEGAPRVLVFQGSHMYGLGKKYFSNAFGEYDYIINYGNTMELDYCFGLFQPDGVIFEVAEFMMAESRFPAGRMAAMNLNPALTSVRRTAGERESLVLRDEDVSVRQGAALTVVSWTGGNGDEEYVWAVLDGEEYDMRRNSEGVYETTMFNETWEQSGGELTVAAKAGEVLRTYH